MCSGSCLEGGREDNAQVASFLLRVQGGGWGWGWAWEVVGGQSSKKGGLKA